MVLLPLSQWARPSHWLWELTQVEDLSHWTYIGSKERDESDLQFHFKNKIDIGNYGKAQSRSLKQPLFCCIMYIKYGGNIDMMNCKPVYCNCNFVLLSCTVSTIPLPPQLLLKLQTHGTASTSFKIFSSFPQMWTFPLTNYSGLTSSTGLISVAGLRPQLSHNSAGLEMGDLYKWKGRNAPFARWHSTCF